MRRMVVVCVAWMAVLALAAAARAQPAPVIEVTALDKDGRPVRDLTAGDFDLSINGRALPVRAAALLNTGSAMVGAVGPSFDKVTPAPPIAVYRLTLDAAIDPSATLVVNVKRVGVSAIANRRPASTAPSAAGRGGAPPAANASPEERLRSAIASGRADKTIDIAFATAVRRGNDPSRVELDVTVDIPAATPGPLTAMLGVVNASGGIGTARKQIDPPPAGTPYDVMFSVPLAPGAYKVRFAVADANGAIGFVESSVDAQLARIGPLLASTLRRTIVDAGGTARPMTREAIPPGAKLLGASFELYAGAGAPGDLLVQMALVPAGANPAAAIERVVTPEVKDGVMTAEAEFPLDRLAAGTYLLRATVMSGATTLGSVSVTVQR